MGDLSGNNNTGSLVADTHFVPGKFGSALDFDGTGDYADCGNNTILNPGTGDLSVSIWVKTTDTPGIFASKRNLTVAGDADNEGWVLYISGNKARFLITDVQNNYYATSSSDVNDGNWHHIIGVRAGNRVKIYFDGILEEDVAGTTNSIDSTRKVLFGNQINFDAGSYLAGLIDHVMIWGRALSASEIALLYREPFCMFEEAIRPKLIGGQIVNLAGNSVALSSLSATAKALRKVGGNVVSTSDVAAILNLIRSLLYIESNWKREALFNGMTANAFKLGTTLSLGWFWVRVAGCSVLYRGSSMGEIDFVNILAVAEQDACEISPPSYISHNSGSTYFYIVRRFNNCGYQERTLAASVKVSIEPNGELAKPQPNKVFDSGAELVDGNKILLVWYYCPLEQKSQPMCFNVYYDGRTGQINYENPLAIIGYKGRKFYSYQCGALEAGRYLFAIRTEDASGIENSSLARLRIQFDPTNPDAIDILSAEVV